MKVLGLNQPSSYKPNPVPNNEDYGAEQLSRPYNSSRTKLTESPYATSVYTSDVTEL